MSNSITSDTLSCMSINDYSNLKTYINNAQNTISNVISTPNPISSCLSINDYGNLKTYINNAQNTLFNVII